MKKKICLVGFSGEELESLRSFLSRLAASWDCVFFPDGAPALAALAAGLFDAVVVTAGKGSIDGAEFMHQAAARQPKATRLILGDVTDQELIINCIGATHQFIAKPCKPQDLIASIQRSLALDACMSSDQIRSLAPKLRRLPSLPSAYFEVLKQVESSSASIQSIAEVITRDPALTARLLQMVNSAAFALAQKVTDPKDAVSLLGMETVKSLVLCIQVFAQNDAAKQSGISLDQLWEHSITVAKMARDITLFQTNDVQMANEAFTAGLLHDVGRIVIASNLPKEYAEAVKAAKEQTRPLYVQEVAQFGVHHAQVGAYLMGLWGMPAAIVEATALHHNPSRTPAHEFSLLTAVHAADVFAHEKEGGKSEFVQPKLDPNYLSALALDDEPEVWKKVAAGEIPASADHRKTKASEKSGARQATVAPLVPPLPVETGNHGIPNFNLLLSACAVVVIVTAVFLWQHVYQSNDTVLAKAGPADDNTAVVAPALDPSTNPLVGDASQPKPEVVPAPTSTVVQNSKPAVVENTNSNLAAVMETTNSSQGAVVETTNSSATAAAPSGFDSVKLEGILFEGDTSSAILNGRTLSVGDHINGLLVEAIDATGVILSFEGHEKLLKLK